MNVTFRKVLGGGVKVLRQTLWKEAVRVKEPSNVRRVLQNQTFSEQLSISPAVHYWKSFLSKPPSLGRVNCVWETLSVRLRKEAVDRLFSPFSRGARQGAHRIGRTYVPYLAFGFVGLVLTENDETSSSLRSLRDAGSFEKCCSSIRKDKQTELNFKRDGEEDIIYPKHLQGYDIKDKLIAKGSYGAIYPARISQSPTADLSVCAPGEIRSSAITEERKSSDLENVSESRSEDSCESKEWEFISQEEMQTNFYTANEEWTVVEKAAVSENSLPLSQADITLSKAPLQKEPEGMTNVSKRKKKLKLSQFQGEFNLALKIIFNDKIRSDSSAIETAFEKEKILLSDKLHPRGRIKHVRSHPNIVRVHQAFVGDNISSRLSEAKQMFPFALPRNQFDEGRGRSMFMYLVMRRYEMTLHQYVKTHGCSDEGMAELMLCQLLEGVAYLNSLNIAHRDLKSNNILVEVDCCGVPRLVITDFGCCLAGGESLKVPWYAPSSVCGNTALTAPEIKAVIYNRWVYTGLDYSKSDGWALGALGYEICGMENPFYRRGVDSATYDEKSLPRFPNFVSPEFEFVILGLLKKDAKERLTCVEAADMLHLLLWKKDYWMKGPVNLRKLSYLKQRLHGWLHEVANPVDGTALEEISPVRTELQVTFLSRVNGERLLKAATQLILFSWQRWLQEKVTNMGFNINEF